MAGLKVHRLLIVLGGHELELVDGLGMLLECEDTLLGVAEEVQEPLRLQGLEVKLLREAH